MAHIFLPYFWQSRWCAQLNLIKLFIYCRLARQFTEEEDIVVTEDAFHGNLGILIDISPKMHGYVPNYKCKDFVHITPLPMSYNRSKLLEEEPPSDLKGKPKTFPVNWVGKQSFLVLILTSA